MRKLMLSVLALTMVGVVAVEAQAGGGRRGRAWNRPSASSNSATPNPDQPANIPSRTEVTSSVTKASSDSPSANTAAPTYYYSNSRSC